MREDRLNPRGTPRSPATRPVAQAPSALVTRAEAVASTLPPLLVAAERIAATVTQGVHGRRRVGSGESFWQFRRYEPGDAAQRIDWRQSGKSEHLFIRQTEWEAAQSVWLWRDASGSMHYTSSPRWATKRGVAEVLLVALAALLVRGGERIALLDADAPPATGRTVLSRLALTLERAGQSEVNVPTRRLLPRHARIVWLSDFLAPLDTIADAIRRFSGQGVIGHLVHIVDPAEESLPFSGRVLFEGCEREDDLLFGRVETVRERYRNVFAQHQQAVRDLVRSAGWTILTHRADQPLQPLLLALYLRMSEMTRR